MLDDIYQNDLIIKTFSVHYSFVTPTKTLRNFKVAPPKASLALAITAVSNNMIQSAGVNCLTGRTLA
jgi:hypothetical protein